MLGREPMNFTKGGYALGNTVQGWTRLESTSRRQRAILRRVYRGLEPRAYGLHYGMHQQRAWWPGTALVVKDPFAVAAVAAIREHCPWVRPVLVYRHPAAIFDSYRRQGWKPDVDRAESALRAGGGRLAGGDDQATHATEADAQTFGEAYAALYGAALEWVSSMPDAVVVSQRRLVQGGWGALFDELGLSRPAGISEPPIELHRASALHDFRRAPSDLVDGWGQRLAEDEIEMLWDSAGHVYKRLEDLAIGTNAGDSSV